MQKSIPSSVWVYALYITSYVYSSCKYIFFILAQASPSERASTPVAHQWSNRWCNRLPGPGMQRYLPSKKRFREPNGSIHDFCAIRNAPEVTALFHQKTSVGHLIARACDDTCNIIVRRITIQWSNCWKWRRNCCCNWWRNCCSKWWLVKELSKWFSVNLPSLNRLPHREAIKPSLNRGGYNEEEEEEECEASVTELVSCGRDVCACAWNIPPVPTVSGIRVCVYVWMGFRRSTATYAHKWNVLSTIIISTGGLMRISGMPSRTSLATLPVSHPLPSVTLQGPVYIRPTRKKSIHD